jgi:adenylate cyclase
MTSPGAGQDPSTWRAALRHVLPGEREVDPESEAGVDAVADDSTEVAEPTPDGVRLSSDELEARIDRMVLRAPRQFSRLQVQELAGVDAERTRTLWRAMGFADVSESDVMFNERDVVALSRLAELVDAGVMSERVQVAVVRSIAQAMAGLATWQVERLYEMLTERPDRPVDLRVVLPALERLQNHVWRRHLAVAAGRLLATSPHEADVRTLTVGSTDLVGFTRTARRLTPSQLIELVELFHGIAADVVAEHDGRIVKTVGDAVLFVTDQPEHAAEIALDLLDRTIAAPGLPELRTGLAIGPTLTRFGDIYGEVVDTASRLCAHARPGRILVDQALAEALEDDPRFRLRLRRPITERGYPRLHPWGLRRASTEQTANG